MALEVPLRLSGYEVMAVSDGHEAIELARCNNFDVVLTDIFMPGVGGLEVVREVRRFSQGTTKIIAMTGRGSLEIAFEAIEQGAFDFIAKPFEVDEVLALVKRATEHHEAPRAISTESDQDFSASGLIGHSPKIVRAYKLISYAARTETTVLIEGESGTGKELVARAIHQYGRRAERPFTAVNCSALTETLLESELFGYSRGSFTGASSDRAGLFESTDGGTIFLDELSTMSPGFQANLLRVLQEKEVRRLGEHKSRRVDVRVIGATNSNLEELVESGQFRADLFYRLSVLTIDLPPLGARGNEDLELLARHFLKKHARAADTPIQIADDALELLSGYTWPGNVRELENTIEHAIAVCSNRIITIDDLPERIVDRSSPRAAPAVSAPVSLADDRPTLEELNRRYITFILSETGGNKSRAAEILGINRRTLYRYLDPFSEESQPDESDSEELAGLSSPQHP